MGDPHRSRLRWRCRRGMRELDVLLVRYLDRRYAGATRAEQLAFEALLDLPDVEILALLKHDVVAEDAATCHVIERLLSDH